MDLKQLRIFFLIFITLTIVSNAYASFDIINEDFSGTADPLSYLYQDPNVSHDSFGWSAANQNIWGEARRGASATTLEFGTAERAYVVFSAAGYGDADKYLEYTEDFDFSFDIKFSSFAPGSGEPVLIGFWYSPEDAEASNSDHWSWWANRQHFVGVQISEDGATVQLLFIFSNNGTWSNKTVSADLATTSLSVGINYRIEGHYRYDGSTYGQLFGKLTNLNTGIIVGEVAQETVIQDDPDIYSVAYVNFTADTANRQFLSLSNMGVGNSTAGTTRNPGPHFTSDNWILSVYNPVVLTSISVNPPLNAVYLGHDAKLFCEGFDSGGTRYDVSDWVEWQSENPEIISIDQASRTATGNILGSTNIRAAFNGLVSNLVPFHVLPARSPNPTSFGLDTLLQWRELSRLKTGTEAGMASSYYRTFAFNTTTGDYNCYDSHPYRAYGNVDPVTVRVLQGPGVITRTWMPWVPGPEFKLKFYFDGETSPRLDTMTLNWYDWGISGHAAIEEPFVGRGTGGAFCYTPLYFQNSLRIESDNRSGFNNFYQMNYLYLPEDTIVPTYTGTQDYTWWADWHLAAEILYAKGENPGPPASHISQTSGIIDSGQTLGLADMKESGIVTRLQIKLNNPTDAQLSGTKLRISYGFSGTPAINISLADFFGVGQNRYLYKALALGTDDPDGYYCYLPMPFFYGIRIELSNNSVETVNILNAEIEYELAEIDKSYGYLHARHNQRMLEPAMEDMIEILNVPSGEGHYLGCLMTVTPGASEFGYLEGNEKITVDGGVKETLYGTGLEDAFNGGYYYKELFGGPFSGLLKKQAGVTSQYRHCIMDSVPFEHSILVQQQGVDCWNKEYQRTYDTTAYWYQKAPPTLTVSRNGANTYHLVWDYPGSFDLEFDDTPEFESQGTVDVTGLTEYDFSSVESVMFFRLKNK